ncbi:hypothetical protein F53441_5749 [Fusarium austroafricanum]|uniref:Uncharacterized protein n=1 Tax=Fusarium austroafricanum TaxID=2364996 RepID=A0A8H4P7W6_9HYPO|nr:hypothetical protein F53441_5749 [Fusarium austroafricanum]
MLSFVAVLGLGLTLFPYSAYCDGKFISPPQVDKDQASDFDFQRNRVYNVGDKIQIAWETDENDTELWLFQTLGPLDSDEWAQLDATRTEWKAEYDVKEISKNAEDSMYGFVIRSWGGSRIAQSQFFNVSAPESEKMKTRTTVQTTTSLPPESSATRTAADTTTEPTAEPSATTRLTNEDTNTSPDSGLSKGETAGAAVGATIGGLLVFGGVGWLLWERLSSRKGSTMPSELEAHLQQPQLREPKAELPGDHGRLDPNYARSPPGLHEAP